MGCYEALQHFLRGRLAGADLIRVTKGDAAFGLTNTHKRLPLPPAGGGSVAFLYMVCFFRNFFEKALAFFAFLCYNDITSWSW